VQPIHLTFLNGPDVERLALTDTEILAAVERGLEAQGRKQVVIEPRMHLVPQDSSIGHFNVLRGAVLPLGLAGVKVVDLHAELGQIVAGTKPGRQNDQETILFWHRGLSLSDIALGHAMLEKAKALGVGQTLRFS
jgi:ornithine cyclodeaminase/alanine dehydrogenase-like protein (mu-crystallin family)